MDFSYSLFLTLVAQDVLHIKHDLWVLVGNILAFPQA